VKILRLGISDDIHGDIAIEKRSYHLSQEKLAAHTGKPWETVLDSAWPSPSLQRRYEKRLEEIKPDLVFLSCAAFWVSYPSGPLKVQRSKLPFGPKLARAGFWLAAKPGIGHTPAFRAGRRLFLRTAGAAFYFEPEEVLDEIEKIIRTTLQREEIALAVRGPLPMHLPGSAEQRSEGERRRAQFDAGLRSLCDSLHVAYASYGPDDLHPRTELTGDRVHVNEAGHARRAEVEFAVMREAWDAHEAANPDKR